MQPLDHALRRARYRHQLDVLGRDAAGQSLRLCNRHWSASRSSGFAVSRHFNLLPRGAQSRAPRTERVGIAPAYPVRMVEGEHAQCPPYNATPLRRVGKIACRERAMRAGASEAILPTRTNVADRGARAALPEGSHCGWAACPRLRRSLPLPPFRHSGLHSHGIRTARPLISSTRAHGEPDVGTSPKDAPAKANPMIDLYALTSPNVQKVYVMLEECGLPYKEHFVDVWKGDQYKPEFAQDQSEQQDSRDRRSRRPGRQAVHRDRVRRDPDVSRREERKVSAQGHGQEVRRDAVADDPAHRRRADVRPVDPFQAVRAEDRQ